MHYLLEKMGDKMLEEVDRNGANPAHWAARSNKVPIHSRLLGIALRLATIVTITALNHLTSPATVFILIFSQLNALRLIVEKKPESLAAKNRDGKVPKEMCFSDDVARYGLQPRSVLDQCMGVGICSCICIM